MFRHSEHGCGVLDGTLQWSRQAIEGYQLSVLDESDHIDAAGRARDQTDKLQGAATNCEERVLLPALLKELPEDRQRFVKAVS